MALFSKRKKVDDSSVSTLIISPIENNKSDLFINSMNSIKSKNDNITFKISQKEINVSNSKQAIKTVSKSKLYEFDVIIFYECDDIIDQLLPSARNENCNLFIIIFSDNANESAIFREKVFNLRCNMITKDVLSISRVYEIISNCKSNYLLNKDNKSISMYKCPYDLCNIINLTENDLWFHYPLYHIGSKNLLKVICPICNKEYGANTKPFQVHLRNKHGLCKSNQCEPEFKHGVPSYIFSLVVVKRPSDNKFLLVQEFASCGFWLPGGRVDPGETTESAAIRETLEEAGVKIKLKGLLKIEYNAYKFENDQYKHNPENDYNRMRVIYYAEPDQDDDDVKDDDNDNDNNKLLAKSIPDYESMGACWVNQDEITKIKLRGYEPNEWIPYITRGGKIYPLELLECQQQKLIR